jgi:hypothetical protein
MALSSTAANIAITDGSGAASNVSNGGSFQYTPGGTITVALQSTSGIGKWTFQFICPAVSSLHLVTRDWLPGQANAFTFPMPAAPVSGTNPASGIQIISMVSDASGGSIPTSLAFLQAKGGAAVPMQHVADYVIVTALPAYTNVGGTLTGTGNAAVTSTMADGATPAVGDIFLLEQGRAAGAADVGLYQLVTVGSGSVPFGAARIGDMATGAVMLPKTEVLVGFRGTVFGGTTWVNTLTGLSNVVNTASFTFFPRQVTWTSAMVAGIVTAGVGATAGAPAVASIQSATLTNFLYTRRTPNTCTATITYQMDTGVVAAGGLGTGAASVFATVAAGTINNADISTMNVTYVNPC